MCVCVLAPEKRERFSPLFDLKVHGGTDTSAPPLDGSPETMSVQLLSSFRGGVVEGALALKTGGLVLVCV